MAFYDDDDLSFEEINISVGSTIQIRTCLDYVCDCSATTLSLENQNGPEGGLTLHIHEDSTVSVQSDGDFGSVTMRATMTEVELQALRRELERITQLRGNEGGNVLKEPVDE